MAAKFPSIALVKYRGRGGDGRDEDRDKGMENGGHEGRSRAAGDVLSRMQGKDASQLRKLRFCSHPLRAHRPRKSVMTSGGAPVVLPRWRPGGEILETFTCVQGRCTVCSADALDYLRFTPRRFEWIASNAPCRRRMLRANGSSGEPLSPGLMTERGRSPE